MKFRITIELPVKFSWKFHKAYWFSNLVTTWEHRSYSWLGVNWAVTRYDIENTFPWGRTGGFRARLSDHPFVVRKEQKEANGG